MCRRQMIIPYHQKNTNIHVKQKPLYSWLITPPKKVQQSQIQNGVCLLNLRSDALGGTSKTLMFVNCSPASSNFEEIILLFGNVVGRCWNGCKENQMQDKMNNPGRMIVYWIISGSFMMQFDLDQNDKIYQVEPYQWSQRIEILNLQKICTYILV